MKILKAIFWMFAVIVLPTEECCDSAVQVQVGGIMRVTAYCPCEKCCGRWANGITASGHRIQKNARFVAAPKNILFGAKFIVPGYNNSKPVPVLDRGGAINGNMLDVFFDSHQEALNWGVQYLKVEKFKN